MCNRKLAPLFFVFALLARTVQFKLTQCIVDDKMTTKITYTDQTGPDSVEQARPGRVDQGRARQGRTRPGRPGRVEQSNVRQGRAAPRRARQGQTGPGRVRRDWAGPDSAEQCQAGPDGPGRARQD